MATFEKERKIRDNIVQRCTNPKDTHYKEYGGRGITICPEWLDNKTGFASFIEHIGPIPTDKHTIDRADNERGYEPGNVRWATRRQQARNRRSTRNITYKGKTQCLQAWADETGLDRACLARRLDGKGNWSIEEAFTTPSSTIHKGRNDKARQDTGLHLKYKGESLSIRRWSKRTGISMQTIRNRYKSGMSIDDIFNKPVQDYSA